MILKIIKKVGKHVSLETLVRLSARCTADILFYSMSGVKNPRVAITVTAATTIIKESSVVAKKYKRTNFDSTVIFEESIDAVTDAF